MQISLKDKVCIITGGSSGIGEAMVTQFRESGAKVCNLDLRPSEDKNVEYYTADVSNQSQICKVIKEIFSQHKRIDVLINNAGIAHVGNLEKTNEEDLDRLYRVNIKGVYNCMFSAIPFMKETGGVILNMASVAASIGLPDRFAYSMTKAAVESMTYTVARDYIGFGIRCNCISPGRVHTPFVDQFIAKNYPGKEKEIFDQLSKTQPIGRMGKAKEIAQLAAYLASDEASFITGSNFPIDGGFEKLNT